MKTTLIQLDIEWGNPLENIRRVEHLLEECTARNVEYRLCHRTRWNRRIRRKQRLSAMDALDSQTPELRHFWEFSNEHK